MRSETVVFSMESNSDLTTDDFVHGVTERFQFLAQGFPVDSIRFSYLFLFLFQSLNKPRNVFLGGKG